MPAQADKLMQENMSKNLIDQDEYPITRMAILKLYLVPLADLWDFQRFYILDVCCKGNSHVQSC